MYYNLEGDALDAYNKNIQELIAKAKEELGLPRDELVVRPIRAEDIGFSAAQFLTTVAKASTNGWVNIVNTVTIADNRFVMINGVSRGFGQGTTNVFSQLRVTKAGKTARIWNIQGVEDFITNAVYWDDPVDVKQNQQLTIEGYAVNSTTDKMIFLGAVVEKRGLIINP
ncbi:hypothetical protein LCGC14_1171670 [marine sediment metagenome]|uniref:Uncharacterized protein n=1 Tax=marine sediment metagenome TaxID=412755 RepID=A0A0F9MCK9_9ZZZZ